LWLLKNYLKMENGYGVSLGGSGLTDLSSGQAWHPKEHQKFAHRKRTILPPNQNRIGVTVSLLEAGLIFDLKWSGPLPEGAQAS
jgi:hypothetical protein